MRLSFLAFLLVSLVVTTLAPASLQVVRPRCEYRNEPMGIDSAQPRLCWVLASEERGQRQSAYQVQVASSSEKLAADAADLWDSGKVPSDKSIKADYTGKPLASLSQCFWRVRVWDAKDQPSPWTN